MGAFLIVFLILVSTVTFWLGSYLASRQAVEIRKNFVDAALASEKHHQDVIAAKNEELQAVRTELTLAERRAPKPAGDTIQAKNWRQVLAINEHERADQEREEETKRANTERH